MGLGLEIERSFWARGYQALAGVDEAGRGPLAGPVVAAAVVFPRDFDPIAGINDSKKLSADARERLFDLIRAEGQFAIALVGPGEIDRINILRASLQAMAEAVAALPEPPALALVDGNRKAPLEIPQETLVRGDARCYSIAAASILAKVYRDRLMRDLHGRYPQYGFAAHKGYPTKAHLEALRAHGPCPEHRRTFRGVKEL